MKRPARLTNVSASNGDTSLAALLLEALPLNRPVYAACLAAAGPQGTRIATIGCDLHDTFHIGSISKALNGLIYTEMVHAGLISPHDQLADYLPLAGTASGEATLESCLTHTSGLPATGGGTRAAARALVAVLTGGDPQPESVEALINQLRKSRVSNPGRFSYSNLAASALGHALAAANGTDYFNLVRNRLAIPLGCPRLRAQQPGQRNLPHDVKAFTVWGTEQRPWTGQGYGPAGVIRGSARDFATILSALLSNEDPYSDAFRVRFTDDTESIAAGWFVEDERDRHLVWHNGYASGFGAHMVLDRENRQGAFISVVSPWPDPDIEPIAMRALNAAM